jgi:hypothetical protein
VARSCFSSSSSIPCLPFPWYEPRGDKDDNDTSLRIDDSLQAAAAIFNGADYTITDKKNNAGSRKTNELTFVAGNDIKKP